MEYCDHSMIKKLVPKVARIVRVKYFNFVKVNDGRKASFENGRSSSVAEG